MFIFFSQDFVLTSSTESEEGGEKNSGVQTLVCGNEGCCGKLKFALFF
jgi:hypothetical protein